VERALSAVRTIRASGATAREVETVGRSADDAYEAGVRVARLEALVSPAGSIAVQGAFLAVLGLGGYRVATGAITVADLVAFILYLFLLVMPLGRVISAWTQLQTGLGALGRIEEVLQLPAEAETGTSGPGTGVGLELDDVRFAYADGVPVLDGVTFTVEPGTRTALVGERRLPRAGPVAAQPRRRDRCVRHPHSGGGRARGRSHLPSARSRDHRAGHP